MHRVVKPKRGSGFVESLHAPLAESVVAVVHDFNVRRPGLAKLLNHLVEGLAEHVQHRESNSELRHGYSSQSRVYQFESHLITMITDGNQEPIVCDCTSLGSQFSNRNYRLNGIRNYLVTGIEIFCVHNGFCVCAHNRENRVSGLEAVCFQLKQCFGIVRAIVFHCAICDGIRLSGELQKRWAAQNPWADEAVWFAREG
jgi:hypothetical protein